jgi:tetratricopeptide (TPR) repeat protein
VNSPLIIQPKLVDCRTVSALAIIFLVAFANWFYYADLGEVTWRGLWRSGLLAKEDGDFALAESCWLMAAAAQRSEPSDDSLWLQAQDKYRDLIFTLHCHRDRRAVIRARIASDLATYYDIHSRYANAEIWYAEACNTAMQAYGAKSLTYANQLFDYERFYEAQNRTHEAVEVMQKRVQVMFKRGDPDDAALALNELAMLHEAEGNPETAIKEYTVAIRLVKNNHIARAAMMNNLGLTLHHLGREVEAGQMFKQAWERRACAFGDQSGIAADSIFNLAETYRARKMYSEAEPLFKRAILASQRNLRSPLYSALLDQYWSENIAHIQKNNQELSEICAAQGKFAEAKSVLADCRKFIIEASRERRARRIAADLALQH